MRVIAGSARRLQLVAPEGLETRPTGDKIRETLFNMLQWDIPGSTFLDLFSGSGAIAIEALSRGAESAVLVDASRKACACIRKNLETTKFTESGRLIFGDVMSAIRKLESEGRTFDFIYMDPPFRHETEKDVLERLRGSSLVKEDTVIIVEAARETDFSYLEEMGYHLVREKIYKTSRHEFLKRGGEE
jgi:16S rRNA (guanine966-N2)-methyltransferase